MGGACWPASHTEAVFLLLLVLISSSVYVFLSCLWIVIRQYNQGFLWRPEEDEDQSMTV